MSKDKLDHVHRRESAKAPTIPHAEPIRGTHVEIKQETNPVKRFFKLLGPGLITGAADDDPSGIGTYSIAGAGLGFAQLWVGIYSIPLMVAVQTIAGRIGLVTGEGLAGTLRRHYPRWLAYGMVTGLVVSNT